MSIEPPRFSGKPSWIGPRRYVEQKWQIDQAAKTSVENRSSGYQAVCGPESIPDFASVRNRVNKQADTGYQGGRIPAVVSFQGMDGFKEMGVSLYGDRWLERGIAVLAVEGPGQYECPVLGIYVSMPSWIEAGPVLMNWMRSRPEVDPERIGLFGSSFGSFFSTICAANEPRFRACAVRATCLEPGGHSIFQEAPPMYKRRFMYMADYTDEAAFDEFRKTLTWEGHAEKIRASYLCMAGESDNLSPLHHTERMFSVLKCPRQLVIYQDAPHGLGGVPSHNLGPESSGFIADWMRDRLHGKPMQSERWYVQANGQIVKTPY